MGCVMVMVAAFRLAWLIYGSVQVFGTTYNTCPGHYTQALVYVLTQWSLIALFFVLACLGCTCVAYCAALLGRG